MFRSASQFDKLLEKATSSLKLEPDWPVIMQICDQIRQGDVQPKYALAAIKKKMLTPNPHVALFSLNVLEAVVKNCGCLIHDEIGTKAYMEQLRETIKTVSNENVKNKLLELIRAWAYAFRNSPKYRAVQDTVILMKAEGFNFPQLKESDAMFSADTAPEWADGDCCHRCRVTFSLVQRKHHCRACGQVFCGQCTNKSCTLPKFGIEKEVRVCEACYEKFSKPTTTTTSKADDLPAEYLSSSLAQQSQAPPPRKSEAELKEEEELQLAIALSQSEAEHKSIATQRTTSIATRTKSYSPPPKLSTSPEADPELARYLNRSYWQQQQQQQQQQNHEYSNASAPIMTATINQNSILEQNGVEDIEMDEFVVALQSQVEIFVNRMKSNSSRGRSIANDSSVQTLFINITTMHSRLLRYIQQQDDRRVYFEGLQDKLAQVKDARAALDALREEHREKLRREAEIAERQRQLQMAQKLDIMRKKKQEYLQYQRQLALQKIQEQEREMQLRQEQQKQQYLIGAQYGTLPYMGPGYDMPGRYPAPGSQAPPFAHFPPTGPPVPMDGSMPPRGGIPMSPPHMPSDPQGMVMHPGMMRPPGMVPPNMVPLGPPGAHPQMIPPNGGPMGPQAFSPPTSMPGTQTLPRTMSVPGPAMMSGSHTLPREHIPIQMNGPQPDHQLGAHPSLGQPMPMPLPGQKEPFQHQLPGQPPHSVQPQSIPMGPGMPHMSNQPLLTTMPQASLPSHIPPQGVPQMIPAQTPQQPMIAPQFPQVPTSQPQPPPQPQQEEKTAELISFD